MRNKLLRGHWIAEEEHARLLEAERMLSLVLEWYFPEQEKYTSPSEMNDAYGDFIAKLLQYRSNRNAAG